MPEPNDIESLIVEARMAPAVTLVPPSTTESKIRRVFSRLAIGIVVLGGIVVIGSVIGRGPELKVSLDDSLGLVIQNVGTKPVIIRQISTNERTECTAEYVVNNPKASNFGRFVSNPIQLNVGDSQSYILNCNAVRVKIDTSDGSAEYTFE